MDLLIKLQEWYASQCEGEWEHDHGIVIESCDNPGWWVKINLAGTALQSRTFTPVVENVDANRFPLGPRWLQCHIVDDIWNGAGDETKLTVILQMFLSWATQADS